MISLRSKKQERIVACAKRYTRIVSELSEHVFSAYVQFAIAYTYTHENGRITFRLRDVVKQLGIPYKPDREDDSDVAVRIPFELTPERGFVIKKGELPLGIEATRIYVDFLDATVHVRYRRAEVRND